MNKRIRMLANHYRRWNIPINDSPSFEKFRNRVLTKVTEYLHLYYSANSERDKRFAYLSGQKTRIGGIFVCNLNPLFDDFDKSHIFQAIEQCSSVPELATTLHWLFHMLEEDGYAKRPALAESISDAAELSPGIGMHVVKRGTSVLFYPSGAKFLDEGVVNEPLEWLQDYPKVANKFAAALKVYATGDRDKHRNLLDDLRLALELLLRALLNNDKSLENQKSVLLPWLKQRGLHQQVVNMFDSLLGRYAAYQNDAVKHGEKYSSDEIEFMIYLTGTFMRLLLQAYRQKMKSGLSSSNQQDPNS